MSPVMDASVAVGEPEFDEEAAEVLGGLRSSVANVIASVGGVRKPADLQKSFKLDWTLSWQLFQVAGAAGGSGSALGVGANVPSKTSLTKFLEAAQGKGVEAGKLERVRAEYERFEKLVEDHAGDRGTFNSMVSAAAGIDEEWLAADGQHRRNAYRAMSHMVGMQAKAKHICGVMKPDGAGHWDFAVVSGYVGLRMLRAMPSALVFRARVLGAEAREKTERRALGDGEGPCSYLLSEFSTRPTPRMQVRELDAGWVVSELDRPGVGNRGASTLRFGSAYLGHPSLPLKGDDRTHDDWTADVAVDKPVEILVSDNLVAPGMMRGARPEGRMILGNNHGDAPALPGDRVELPGDYSIEMVGKGPDALATPDVPDYPEMIRAAAGKLGWNVEDFEVWRMRVEYPVYGATARVEWRIPRG